MVRRKYARSAASPVRPRSGLAKDRTVYPSRRRSAISPFQLEVSAQAPCTRTMVGFALHACIGRGAAAAVPRERMASRTATQDTPRNLVSSFMPYLPEAVDARSGSFGRSLLQ